MTYNQKEWIHLALMWFVIWLLFWSPITPFKRGKSKLGYYSNADYIADKWEVRARPY